MNRPSMKERSSRLALVLFFSFVVFCTLILTLLFTGILVYQFNKWGFFIPDGEAELGLVRSMLLMMGLSLIVGTALTFVVIRIPLAPVYALIDGMKKLAGGDYRARLDTGRIVSHWKLGSDIKESFNTLAVELENTEMLRSDFINNFSHEFKTPIVSIAGFAKVLKRGNLTEEQKAEYLDIIEEESLRLSYMATNVLNLTKVQNQNILSDTQNYNLSEQFRDCVLMLESKWEKRDIRLGLDFEEHMICANEELMKQVWINLVDNAIKFSPEGGSVDISVSEGEERISIAVSNTGQPIGEEDRARIFNKFYQADCSHSTEGNGIGLAIVKHIVALHKGSIEVKSGEGVNSFVVTLPRSC